VKGDTVPNTLTLRERHIRAVAWPEPRFEPGARVAALSATKGRQQRRIKTTKALRRNECLGNRPSQLPSRGWWWWGVHLSTGIAFHSGRNISDQLYTKMSRRLTLSAYKIQRFTLA